MVVEQHVMPQVHLRIGDGRGLSYTLYRLYYMYCLRHFRPTHLLKKVPPSSVSLCDLTFSVTRRIGKQRTNCGPMALSIAPPVPGFLLACHNRRCGSRVQEPASPTGCHGACSETCSTRARTGRLRVSEHHTAAGRQSVGSQDASVDYRR